MKPRTRKPKPTTPVGERIVGVIRKRGKVVSLLTMPADAADSGQVRAWQRILSGYLSLTAYPLEGSDDGHTEDD